MCGEKILPLEPTEIYNTGSNGKLVFVLDISALSAVYKERIQLTN
jgi:nitrate reductase NapAB chaperone NapD